MNEDLLNVMGSFSKISLDCLEKQNEEIEQLEKENKQLKDRINKAIEYINWWVEDNKKQKIGLTLSEADGLLILLKEDNKEE